MKNWVVLKGKDFTCFVFRDAQMLRSMLALLYKVKLAASPSPFLSFSSNVFCSFIQTFKIQHSTNPYVAYLALPSPSSVSLSIPWLAFSLLSHPPPLPRSSTLQRLSVRLSLSAGLSGSFLISLLPMRLSLNWKGDWGRPFSHWLTTGNSWRGWCQ